jgi:hypothetical protein
VLTPVFEDISGILRFLQFLDNREEKIQAYPCQFKDDQWLVSPKALTLTWPKTGILYP